MGVRIVLRNRRQEEPNEAERFMVQEAVRNARLMLLALYADLEDLWAQEGGLRKRRRARMQEWNSQEQLVRWMGPSNRHILIRRFKRRVRKLKAWVSRGRIVIILREADARHCRGATAYTLLPRKPVRINLCPGWFNRSPSRQAAILIHELVHQLGVAHPEGTTNAAEALALAERNHRKACRSPENFERLLEEYFPGRAQV